MFDVDARLQCGAAPPMDTGLVEQDTHEAHTLSISSVNRVSDATHLPAN